MKKFIAILLTLLCVISLISCHKWTEQELASANIDYLSAWQRTASLESYTMSVDASLEKGFSKLSIVGELSRQKGEYTGNIKIKVPGQKYDCEYSAPYGDGWGRMYSSKKNTSLYMPFILPEIGSGIFVLMPENAKFEPLNSRFSKLEFHLNNEQIYATYGNMLNYFKELAKDDMDLSDLTFSSSDILIDITNEIITTYSATLYGSSAEGDITCYFWGELIDIVN